MVEKLSAFFNDASNLIKLTVGAFALIAALAAFYARTQALVAMPTELAKHDSAAIARYNSLDKILCITVADHRKMDWHLCFIAPSEVMPAESK